MLSQFHHAIKNRLLSAGERLMRRWGISERTGTYRLETERVVLECHRAPGRRVRVLHLSDFHASPATPYAFISEAVSRGVAMKPDIICLTGDYVTGRISDPALYKQILTQLSLCAPTFACFGNHDGCWNTWIQGGYRRTNQVRQLLEESGITCLENERRTIRVNGCEIVVAGVGDLTAGRFAPGLVLNRTTQRVTEPFLIVLAHTPACVPLLLQYVWDLVLCGHTHGGQIHVPGIGSVLLRELERCYNAGSPYSSMIF